VFSAGLVGAARLQRYAQHCGQAVPGKATPAKESAQAGAISHPRASVQSSISCSRSGQYTTMSAAHH
jgi:hypothetical protein